MKALAILFAAGALMAAPPTLQDLSPRGGQRGKSLTVYLRGDGLLQSARVETTLPASFSRLTLSKDPTTESGRVMRPNALLPFMVSIKPDAPIGLYPIRVVTDSGISNVLLFSVSDLPEIEEAKAGETPQKVVPPVLVNGKLTGPDIDNYTFHAAAGQKLVFEVEARRAGSAIDPAIEIFDASGREIARNDDAPSLGVDSRMEVTFPKAGDYRVAVHDSKFSEQAQNFYRLKIAKFDYADSIFPLGGPKGTEVTLSGGNLTKPVRVKAEGPWIYVPGSFALPMAFAVADKPEVQAPLETLPEGKVINGRIAKAGAIDHYRLPVEPGEKWVFELNAATLGTSRLDAIITAYDTNGKKLAGADDGNGFDPILPFTVPAGVHEIMLSVEDLLGRGGDAYGYRLEARRQHPDFVAEMITPFVNVPAGGTARVSLLIQRRGYAGEMRVTIPNIPAGFKVAGGHVPVEAAQQDYREAIPGRKSAVASLTITAPADAKPQPLDLQVLIEANTEDGVIRRWARGPGLITAVRGDKQKSFTAPWLGMHLPMAVTDPLPLTIAAVTPVAHFAQGFEFELKYEVTRKGAAKTPFRVITQTLGAVGNLRINAGEGKLVGGGKNTEKGMFLLDTNFATPFALFDMAFELQTEVDGKPVNITSPIMELEVAPGYQVKLARNEIELAPGKTMEIPGTIYREPTFEGGLIKLQAEDLPDHVTCGPVEVAAAEHQFKLSCTAGAAVKTGRFPIRISSVAPETGKKAKADYKIPDLTATLQVGKSSLASK
jgi:hypothetical protein